MVEKDLGALPRTLLKNFLKEVFKNFKNFNTIGFLILSFRCADSDVDVCRAANSGCSEPHSASEMRTFPLSPLPDRNGRKLVDDWDGTTRVSFRLWVNVTC